MGERYVCVSVCGVRRREVDGAGLSCCLPTCTHQACLPSLDRPPGHPPDHLLVPPLSPCAGDADPAAEKQRQRLGGGYDWRAADDAPTFFPGRHAGVYFRGTRVGEFGIIHPDVLVAFDIINPGGSRHRRQQ